MVLSREIRLLVYTYMKQIICEKILTNWNVTALLKLILFTSKVDLSCQKPLLLENPHIVVATPVRALLHLKSKNLSLKNSLEMLVIDEADLMFSLGYENDVKDVLK